MKGRTALVTGGSRGIGRAIAEAFRAEGAEVIAPPRAELDLASDASIDAWLAAHKGPMDILVNDAGINPLGSAEDYADGDLEAVLQVNLKAPMRLIRGLLPGMRERGYGRVVNISSVWSLVTKPRRFAYTTAKAAVNGMTRAAAVECARHGVLVNAIAPGYVNTELTRKNNSEAEIKAIAEGIPALRLAEPAEIAALAVFLASSRNGYVTGQTIAADGGYTCL